MMGFTVDVSPCLYDVTDGLRSIGSYETALMFDSTRSSLIRETKFSSSWNVLSTHVLTCKTLLAMVVAGEVEVPLISYSATEFVELYLWMGASRVQELFARATKEAQSIIFIDERRAMMEGFALPVTMTKNKL
ncbi:ATP-dependent zinc metalloprotease FtsH-like [Helianthus annuus]|uniref:ATP-dependent zinc metalloprotease FtsH-like n=1 Tax=Helianthus annuus TaxID=4232 RepID=UPI000B900C5D|nr:ATP-dependent zinc metalloprotease FtsH-like [Helianthus annuus]XP_021973293.1 ATP-dependent zinc metalloprotease FtsH-like [Helianthus annuus]XP_021973294.1 ATP-dependent zinc metalloprotease FtsH-like [Helianthus annuus]